MLKLRTKAAVAAAFIPVVAALALGADAVHAAGSLKAAYTETVIPSRTYTGHMTVLNATTSTGPGTGILGISSLTLTNFDTSPQQVFIFVPIYANPTTTCGGGGNAIVGGTGVQMTLYVPGQSTLHLPYPTPLVINPYNGLTCIAAEVTTLLHGGSVTIDVNGVVN